MFNEVISLKKAGITREQGQNLLKLADYLSGGQLKSRFDMSGYSTCAFGHGPHAGISKGEHEFFYEYTNRAFGSDRDVYDWCFYSGWDEFDNSAIGAAKRIYLMLQYGCPWTVNREWAQSSEFKSYTPDRNQILHNISSLPNPLTP